MPVIFGEWGYSWAGEPDFNEDLQGQYLVRQFLVGMMYGIPINIWYDWKNDRPEPCQTKDKCYGVVRANLVPKKAYYQMQRLSQSLKGYRFVKRLPSAAEDYYLVFSSPTATKVIAWTLGTPHKSVPLPDNAVVNLSSNPVYKPLNVYIKQ